MLRLVAPDMQHENMQRRRVARTERESGVCAECLQDSNALLGCVLILPHHPPFEFWEIVRPPTQYYGEDKI